MYRRLCALLLSLSFVLSARGTFAQNPPAPAPQEPVKTQEERKQAEKTEKKDEKWDVEAEHGPTTLVEFDTDEGTWISCDVSPDG